MKARITPQDALYWLSAERSRLIAAALVSIGFHVAILSLPGPPKTPRDSNHPLSHTALPVELAGSVSFASSSESTPGPKDFTRPEPTVNTTPPNPITGSLGNSPAIERQAPLHSADIAPQGPISLGAGTPTAPGVLTPSPPSATLPGEAPGSRLPGVGEATSPSGATPGSPVASGLADGTSGANGSSSGQPGATGASYGRKFIRAKVIQGPKPPYPERARRRGEEGTVRLEVQVLPTGSVGEVEVVSLPGYQDLVEAAVECVKKQWKFAPATLDGRPAEDKAFVRFVFRRE